jgi:UDP-N-acetylglucosamine 2-epimerase (non-hydrolysing)
VKTLKVMTIVGTRPELIKLCRVIAELRRHTDHVLVHTGQNYDFELNEIFFRELDIPKPDHFLDVRGETLAESIANVIQRSDEVLAAESPDAVLLLGDTNSCLSVIPAKRRKIPIFHMEAGNRCFDARVPEEINRKIVDHTSDINLPYTEHARRYLLAEGLRPETVIKTGSPMAEILAFYRERIESSDVLGKMDLTAGDYFVVSAHREENVDREDHLHAILDALDGLAAEYDRPIIVSTHPRTRARLDRLDRFRSAHAHIRFLKPLGFFDYIQLQKNARCVLSDSGTITEEASILNFPAVTLREAHERPEGMDEGALVMTGLRPERILQAVAMVTAQVREDGRAFRCVEDYQPLNVSAKVARIILGYVDYVNRTVWRKG